jgi:hypothetical protein
MLEYRFSRIANLQRIAAGVIAAGTISSTACDEPATDARVPDAPSRTAEASDTDADNALEADSVVAESTEIVAEAPPPFEVLDSAGVIVVRNRADGLWSADRPWTVEEVLRLGAEDGPEEVMFGPMIRVGLSPRGEIVVIDPQAGVVTVFDGDGTFVRQLGGPGQGPGEFVNPMAMTWDPRGDLWIADPFIRRYSVFNEDGSFVKTVPRPIRGISSRHQILFAGPSSIVDQGAGRSEVPFLRVDTTGAIADSLAAVAVPTRRLGTPPMPSDFDTSVLAYLPNVLWALAPDGTLWLAESGSLRLIQRTMSGDTLRIVETSHRNAELSGSTRRMVDRELSKLGSNLEYDLVRPVVESLDVLSDGHVLVRIVEEVGVDSDLVDVFDPEGRYLGPLRLGFQLSRRNMSAFAGDTIIAVAIGEYDVPYVVRAHIRR